MLHDNLDDLNHFLANDKNAKKIQKIFENIADELASGAYTYSELDGAFNFSKHPKLRALFNKAARRIVHSVTTEIDAQTKASWERGTTKTLNAVRKQVSQLPAMQQALKEAREVNLQALKAFQQRKQGGLNLSDRVWNITKGFKTEMEFALDISIAKGKSAQEISREVRHLLKEPDALYRKVRNKHGNLVLSKAALEYHPQQGVYRSAAKNAMRLARTENNMAYHKAAAEKYDDFDFVVGIEVKLSNNPKHCPFCAAMAGKYPKDFKFAGWHPQCRCTTLPILKTMQEMQDDNDRIAQDKAPAKTSANSVKQPPAAFTNWVETNKARLESAQSLPYWVQDNRKFVFGAPPKTKAVKTPAQMQAIQDKWDARKKLYKNIQNEYQAVKKLAAEFPLDIDVTKLAALHSDFKLFDLQKAAANIKPQLDALADLKLQLKQAIPDAEIYFAQHGITKVDTAFKAAQQKIDEFKALPIEKQLQKLEFEINWVAKHKKYDTWEVSWSLFKKEYQLVKIQQAESEVFEFYNALKLKSSKLHSKEFLALQSEAEAALAKYQQSKDMFDLMDAKHKLTTLDEWVTLKQQKRALRKLKKNGAATDDDWEIKAYITPAERVRLAELEMEFEKAFTDNNGIHDNYSVKARLEMLSDYKKQLSNKYYKKQTRAPKINGETIEQAAKDLKDYLDTTFDTSAMTPVGGNFYTKVLDKEKELIDAMAKHTGMTSEEVALVMRYSYGSGWINKYLYEVVDSYYGKINDYGGRTPLYKTALNDVIEKLPKYNGQVYSGIKNVDIDEYVGWMKASLNTGQPFVNKGFLSTSTQLSTANSFDGQAICVIKSKHGGIMHNISHYESEAEVLMRAGSRFRVKKVYQDKDNKFGGNSQRWIIEMEEI